MLSGFETNYNVPLNTKPYIFSYIMTGTNIIVIPETRRPPPGQYIFDIYVSIIFVVLVCQSSVVVHNYPHCNLQNW